MKNSIPVTLEIMEIKKHQSNFDFDDIHDSDDKVIELDNKYMYDLVDAFIKKYSVKDFVEVLYNVLKDQNEAKKEDKP